MCDEHHARLHFHGLRSTNGLSTHFLHHYCHVEKASNLCNEVRARLLLDVVFDYREQGKYLLHEFVIMPDHIHALLTPAPSISLSGGPVHQGRFFLSTSESGKVWKWWQASFTNHRIRDAEDRELHRDYIRLNPARARLVLDAREYPHSSANPAFKMDELPAGLKPGLRESA